MKDGRARAIGNCAKGKHKYVSTLIGGSEVGRCSRCHAFGPAPIKTTAQKVMEEE